MLPPVFSEFFVNQATNELLTRVQSVFKSIEKDWETAWLARFLQIAEGEGYLCPTLSAIKMLQHHKHGVRITRVDDKVFISGAELTAEMTTDEMVKLMSNYFELPEKSEEV